MRFCAKPDSTTQLAVLGILSAENNRGLRDAIRQSWLPSGAAHGIMVRFVMRGLNAGAQVRQEARERGDEVLFVHADASMPRASGPLQSLLCWLRCAVVAWPLASWVGKADDDVFAHLPDVAASLRRSQSWLQLHYGISSVYWGTMESARWNVSSFLPIDFVHDERVCAKASAKNGFLHGPFLCAAPGPASSINNS